MNVRSQDQRYTSLEKPLNYDEGGQKRMRRKRRRKTTQIVTPRRTDGQRSATRAPTARHKGRPRQPRSSAFPCRLAALRGKGRCFGGGSFYLAFELQCSCQTCRRQKSSRSHPLPRFGSSGEFLSCNYEITAMKIDNYEIKKEKLRDEEAGDGRPPPLSPWEPHLGGCMSVRTCARV